MTALSLRCRRAAPASGPPDLAAFSGGARLTDPEANDPLTWLLPSTPEPGSAGVALRPRLAPIPAPRFERDHSPLDLSAWDIGRDRSRWTFGRSASLVAGIAAALPLALVPSLALGAGKKTPPPTEPVVDTSGLAFGGDMLWEPIIGGDIEVTLGDGVRIRGTLLTQSVEELAVVLAPDGVVMRVPKELIIGLRVLRSPEEVEDEDDDGAEIAELRAIREAVEALTEQRAAAPGAQEERARPKSGKTLAVTGIALTGVGAGLLTIFGVGNAIDSSFAYYTFPMLFIGNGLLGPGIPMMVTGLAMEADRAKWEQEAAGLSFSTGPVRGGWSGSFSVRW